MTDNEDMVVHIQEEPDCEYNENAIATMPLCSDPSVRVAVATSDGGVLALGSGSDCCCTETDCLEPDEDCFDQPYPCSSCSAPVCIDVTIDGELVFEEVYLDDHGDSNSPEGSPCDGFIYKVEAEESGDDSMQLYLRRFQGAWRWELHASYGDETHVFYSAVYRSCFVSIPVDGMQLCAISSNDGLLSSLPDDGICAFIAPGEGCGCDASDFPPVGCLEVNILGGGWGNYFCAPGWEDGAGYAYVFYRPRGEGIYGQDERWYNYILTASSVVPIIWRLYEVSDGGAIFEVDHTTSARDCDYWYGYQDEDYVEQDYWANGTQFDASSCDNTCVCSGPCEACSRDDSAMPETFCIDVGITINGVADAVIFSQKGDCSGIGGCTPYVSFYEDNHTFSMEYVDVGCGAGYYRIVYNGTVYNSSFMVCELHPPYDSAIKWYDSMNNETSDISVTENTSGSYKIYPCACTCTPKRTPPSVDAPDSVTVTHNTSDGCNLPDYFIGTYTASAFLTEGTPVRYTKDDNPDIAITAIADCNNDSVTIYGWAITLSDNSDIVVGEFETNPVDCYVPVTSADIMWSHPDADTGELCILDLQVT